MLISYQQESTFRITVAETSSQRLSLFINSDLRSIYYITKKKLLYTHSILMLTSVNFD